MQTNDNKISVRQQQTTPSAALEMTLQSDISGKQRVDAKLAAAIATESSTSLSKEWSGVEELDTFLYAPAALEDKSKQNAREIFLLAEFTLYLVNDAFDAREHGLLTAEEEDTYFAYVEDIGAHPLFLLAVWY